MLRKEKEEATATLEREREKEDAKGKSQVERLQQKVLELTRRAEMAECERAEERGREAQEIRMLRSEVQRVREAGCDVHDDDSASCWGWCINALCRTSLER